MTDKVFWSILKACCKPDVHPNDWDEPLVAHLRTLPPDDVVGFGAQMIQKLNAAYREELWGAASVINGGASDDGFFYFRCWLIGMGKKVYDAAIANPDSLADVAQDDDENEATIHSAAPRAWEAKGLPRADYERRVRASFEEATIIPAGWDCYEDDAEIRRRWPKLAARFMDDD